MRKFIISVFICILTGSISAQISIHGSHYPSFRQDSVNIIIFDSISNDTRIEYNGNNVRFYKFSNINTTIYETSLYPPDNATGYLIKVDDVPTDTIWVVDYSKYKRNLISIEPENNPDNQCEEVKLLVNVTAPEINFQTISGISHKLHRIFTLNVSYLTSGENESWEKNVHTKQSFPNQVLPVNELSVPAPFCNTSFFLIAYDQFAEEFNIQTDSIPSDPYNAVAVKCYPSSTVQTRDATNEAERPENASDISGSAPLEMSFSSNANATVQNYTWEIFKDGAAEPYISRRDPDLNNTFTEHGSYNVKITVSNNNCSYSDSIAITVSESEIYAPNVFTPNGDGKNDEFRVAYKSIISFEAWVFNRWGRQVYHWTDPQKGWDGNINGRKATPGPYFYVIKALGSDFKPNEKPNKITHLRPGEYLLKGDINLLRGTN